MKKRILPVIILLLIGAFVLAACGAGNNQGSNADSAVMEEPSGDGTMTDETMMEDSSGDETMMEDEHPDDDMMEDTSSDETMTDETMMEDSSNDETMMEDEHPDDEMMEDTSSDETMTDETMMEDESGMMPELPLGGSEFHATNPADVQLASGQVQFVEFFAYWCPVCKQMAPTVHGLEQVYGDQVNFVYLDRDDPATKDLQNALGYVYQPHYFLLDAEGNILGNWTGVVEGKTFQAAIETALQ